MRGCLIQTGRAGDNSIEIVREALRRSQSFRSVVSIQQPCPLCQCKADQTRNDQQKNRKQLKKSCEDASPAGYSLVRCSQGPLHNVLIRAPAPKTDDGSAEQHPSQGKLPLKFQACLTTCPAAYVCITGAQVP